MMCLVVAVWRGEDGVVGGATVEVGKYGKVCPSNGIYDPDNRKPVRATILEFLNETHPSSTPRTLYDHNDDDDDGVTRVGRVTGGRATPVEKVACIPRI